MKIHIATDHAGFELKNKIRDQLSDQGHEVVDHGAHQHDPDDDYPEFIFAAAQALAADQAAGIEALGVVIGGSGNGEQIAANKVAGIRAALVWSQDIAKLARQHNNANIAAIGARQHSPEEALQLIEAFIAEPFSSEERHTRRIEQITDYEQE